MNGNMAIIHSKHKKKGNLLYIELIAIFLIICPAGTQICIRIHTHTHTHTRTNTQNTHIKLFFIISKQDHSTTFVGRSLNS